MLIKTDPAVIAGYLEDASGFLGGHAERLVIPETEQEVAEYLGEASGRREAVTVSGGGTGVTAGRIPCGGTLLSLERLDQLGPVTPAPFGDHIRAGACVRLETLKTAAAAAGLLYGPDPTEWTSTLGGNVATNASGGQSFKYGPTRAHVLGLAVVLPSGETLQLQRGQVRAEQDRLSLPLSSGRRLEFDRPRYRVPGVSKNAAGYFSAPGMDAVDLFIGMEGTLGIITSATLRLLPAPAGTFSLAAFFTEVPAAVACAAAFRAAAQGLGAEEVPRPSSLEFMDSHALDLLRGGFVQIPAEARACLLFEEEYAAGGEDAALSAWARFLEQTGVPEKHVWFAQDASGRRKLRDFRHALPERVNDIVRERKLPKVGTDMAVPAAAFPEMLAVYESRLQASDLEYLIFGHIGDCHLHVNVLPRDETEYRQARGLYLEFARAAVALGGTVSAEHGIGKLKHAFLELMVGRDGLEEMFRVKRALDPSLILNRGNIFPVEWLGP